MFDLGLAGVTRRLDYIYNLDLKPLLWITEAGIFLYFVSIYYFVRMLVRLAHPRPRARTGRCLWHTAAPLEWLTPSPVPFYNFAVTPQMNARDELSWRQEHGLDHAQPEAYDVPIHLPQQYRGARHPRRARLRLRLRARLAHQWLFDVSTAAMIVTVIIRSFARTRAT